jgi:hypothetical protein
MYGISIDNIVAGNKSARAGGFHNMGLNYYGWQPSWFVQYFDNEITEGNGYISPLNDPLPHDSSFFVYGAAAPGNVPTARAAIFRRNRVDSNGRFQVLNACQDVVIENNEIDKSDVGVEVQPTAGGVLVRANKMDGVKEPYTGEGMGKAYLHPAERLAANLRQAHDLLADLDKRRSVGPEGPLSDWQPIFSRLAALALLPADDPVVLPGVEEQLLAALRDPYFKHRGATGLLRPLLGLDLMVAPSPALQEILATGQGGTAPLNVRASLPSWAPPAATLGLAVWWEGLSYPVDLSPVKLAPGKTVDATHFLNIGKGIWGRVQIQLNETVSGDGWRISSIDFIHVGTGALRDWLVVGPFPNPSGGTLDASYYPPEMRLDVAATYDTPAGKITWKPVALAGDRLDFKQALGAPGPGVAYAVAGLRATQATPVTLTVTSDQGCRVYLNDTLIITNPAGGQGQASVQLQAGDNILLAQVTQASGDWNLSAEVAPDAPVAPGGLLPIPAAELQPLSRLRPPPPAPAAPSGAMLLPGGVAWRLLFSDDFNRGAIGPAWKVADGTWEIKNGALCASGNGLIVLNQRIKAPYRLEYDVSSPGPTDMASAWMHDSEGWASGYYFGVCADGGDVNKLMKNGDYVGTGDAPKPGAGKTHHVIAQVLPDRVQLIVDGKLSIDYHEPKPLTEPDTLGLYPWGEAQYRNVKVYVAGP